MIYQQLNNSIQQKKRIPSINQILRGERSKKRKSDLLQQEITQLQNDTNNLSNQIDKKAIENVTLKDQIKILNAQLKRQNNLNQIKRTRTLKKLANLDHETKMNVLERIRKLTKEKENELNNGNESNPNPLSPELLVCFVVFAMMTQNSNMKLTIEKGKNSKISEEDELEEFSESIESIKSTWHSKIIDHKYPEKLFKEYKNFVGNQGRMQVNNQQQETQATDSTKKDLSKTVLIPSCQKCCQKCCQDPLFIDVKQCTNIENTDLFKFQETGKNRTRKKESNSIESEDQKD
ncbi:hypothetical protein M0811_05791 [Anaeramoeba ignava]|uniref:Uncharacterized protein n=1 Tax=Anaeramoeba ignava TaxID=1746090 RepID=A0A9Q0LRJ8_ANAIG|nr:hypothetical protein M0811_05791 [Anaeramoeba ignava]